MLPKPDLLVECAQGFVEGWTADSMRAYAAEQVAAETVRLREMLAVREQEMQKHLVRFNTAAMTLGETT